MSEGFKDDVDQNLEDKENDSASTMNSIPRLIPKSESKKLLGYKFWESLGSPKHVLAPMVDSSHLPWRILAREFGADLCYTPMIHAKLFAMKKPPSQMIKDYLPAKQHPNDSPLIAQFCANDPDEWLRAAKKIEHLVQGVDLNLGCPQDIAKKGNYGSYLQDEWKLIHKLIRQLHEGLETVPVTAKIRIFEDVERTVAYAKMIEDAGAQILTVHGRLRSQRGHASGLADWEMIRAVKEAVSIPVIANGNLLYPEDIPKLLKATGCDAVMSAETQLHNPGIFLPLENGKANADHYPFAHEVAKRYIKIMKREALDSTKWGYLKTHLFKLLKNILKDYPSFRSRLDKASSLDAVEEVLKELTESLEDKKILLNDEFDPTNPNLIDKSGYLQVPNWRCQPCIRERETLSIEDRKAQGKPIVQKDKSIIQSANQD